MNFTDARVDALADFKGDEFGVKRGEYWDAKVPGLMLRVGVRKLTWSFFRQRRQAGKRVAVCRTLGAYPDMNITAAREAATVVTAEIITRTVAPGRRASIKFGAALDQYILHLKRQSERRGKAPEWADRVEHYAKKHLRPAWVGSSLADMASSPAVLAEWHRKLRPTA